jgi:myo-inositol-1(or 4)-monophosphatase
MAAGTDPAELVDLAERVARAAGGLLLDGLHQVRSEVGTKSTGTDMVTEMDRSAEQLIVEAILAERPGDGILGEEGSALAGTSGVRWVIDPLDGTTNYLYRLPGFGVSVAAEVDGLTVAGAVTDPVRAETFTATRGGGAFLDGRPIRHSGQDRLDLGLVATGFGYDPERRRNQARVLAEVLPLVRDVRRFGAAALDLCLVACGRVDAYYERGLAPWDLAAGALIAAEAGAIVSDLEGRAASVDFVVAAAPGIVAELSSVLSAAGADRS